DYICCSYTTSGTWVF
nr:immunoglobulin light chain junction region [Macaca mulatta]